ncbi:hypothetical protein FXO38_08747 [Capsicum annuum]|nr:hypothetical protein FXO38_08747 [Capsicum annuum]
MNCMNDIHIHYSAGNTSQMYLKNLAKEVMFSRLFLIVFNTSRSLFGSIDEAKSSLAIKLMQHDDLSETGEDEMAEASKVTEINSKRKKEYLVLTGWSAVSRHHYLQGKGEDGESCSDEDSSEDEENQTSYTLTKCWFVNMSRDFGYYWMKVLIYLEVSVCVGTMYFNVGTKYVSIQARGACAAFIFGFMTFMSIEVKNRVVTTQTSLTQEEKPTPARNSIYIYFGADKDIPGTGDPNNHPSHQKNRICRHNFLILGM